MRKIAVFIHVAHELLGTLNPLLKERGLRVRYINFDRHPDFEPSMDRYNGLIILGGNMGVYEGDRYKHIKVELQAIEQALKKNVPILGICLGAQLLAHALGSEVRKNREKEIGWYELAMKPSAKEDALLGHFGQKERIFQSHGDTFDIPRGAEHLASTSLCESQAFRYGDKAYGLQFHLEVDAPMIHRWLKTPVHQEAFAASDGKLRPEKILAETETQIARSMALSRETFHRFIALFGITDRPERFRSR